MARIFTGHIDENDCMGDSLGPKLGGSKSTFNQNSYNLDVAIQELSAYDTSLKNAVTINGTSITLTNNLTATGNVFTPSRPTFSAAISGNVQVSTRIGGNTTAITNWNSIPVNVGGHFNTTNGLFTAPVKGIYWFSVSIANNPVTSSHFGDVTLYKNSTNLFGTGGPIVMKPSAGIWTNGSFSMPVSLNAADTVSVGVTNYTGSTGSFYALFSGYLLG